MSTALAVHHGPFGRAALYLLDRPMIRHVHREGHLIFHVDGPPEMMDVCGRCCDLSPGAGVAINPWEPHAYDPRQRAHGVSMLVLYINPLWFEHAAPGGARALRFGQSRVELDPRLRDLVAGMVALVCAGGAAEAFDASLLELTEACYRQTQRGATDGTAASVRRHVSDFRIRRAIRFISAQFGRDIDMGRVAVESGLSRPHFFQLFRDEVGVPPKLFWNTLRMERALSALTGTLQPITQIGLDLGFASSSSFSRFFALNAGMPPTDYRRVARVRAA